MSSDEQDIHEIIRQMEAAWNAGNSAAFAAPFAEDADFVDILGRHHRGRAAIEAGHRQIFETIYRGSRNHYTVERIRFVRPDVAVGFIRARLLSWLGGAVDDARRRLRQGEAMSEAQASMALTLARNHDRWEIVAFQNTKIAEGLDEKTV